MWKPFLVINIFWPYPLTPGQTPVRRLTAVGATVNSVSCPSPGDCAAVGSYTDHPGNAQSFVVTEKNGAWLPAQEITGDLNKGSGVLAGATSVSCPSAGNCAVGAQYTDGAGAPAGLPRHRAEWRLAAGQGNRRRPRQGRERGGRRRLLPDGEQLHAVGYYTAAGVMHTFVVAGAITQPTTTTLALSAAVVRYGHEQSGRITVTVVPRYGGTSAGTVKVRAGHVTVCEITLASGRGSCRLSARQLPRDTYRLTAAYAGGPGFLASTSIAAEIDEFADHVLNIGP